MRKRGRGWEMLLVAVVTACSGVPAPTDGSTITTSTAPTNNEPVDWSSDFTTHLGGAYTLGNCPGGGEAPVVCVFRDSAAIGTVEYLEVPVNSLDYLNGVEDPLQSAELLSADYLTGFRRDREATCPHLEFREAAGVSAFVSRLPGLRFGFSQFEGEREVERNLIYAARDGTVMRLVNAGALEEGACVAAEGAVLRPADLDSIVEGLSQAVAVAVFGGSGG